MRKNGVFLKKAICIIGTVLTVLLVALSTIICFSVKWMFDAWSNLTMDELVYHLTAPLEGTNTGMIKEYLKRDLRWLFCPLHCGGFSGHF